MKTVMCVILIGGLATGCGDGGGSGGAGGGAGRAGMGGAGAGGAGGAAGWRAISTMDAPEARAEAAAVWTGSELLVWGGTVYGSAAQATPFSNGARYDPAADKWRPMAASRAPRPRSSPLAGWTGSAMLVFGGNGTGTVYGDGALYDPDADTWRELAADPGFAANTAYGGCAVFTGAEVFVLAGQWDGNGVAWKGRRLALSTGAWSDWTLQGATPRPARCIWTGTEIVYWGGQDPSTGDAHADGDRFDVAAGTWRPIRGRGAPAGRDGHELVWLDGALYVLGGYSPQGQVLNDLRWDSATDQWRTLSTARDASGLASQIVVTQRGVLALGERDAMGETLGPRLYDAAADRWTALPPSGAPSPRLAAAAVYTGSELVVWGGRGIDFRNVALDDGARLSF